MISIECTLVSVIDTSQDAFILLQSDKTHRLLASERKRCFFFFPFPPQKCFNYCHFSSSLLYATLFLHCCIKLVACERSLWSLTDCLWYRPCIFFVPVIGFPFEDSHAGYREEGFLSNFIFLHCPLHLFPTDKWNLFWNCKCKNWKKKKSFSGCMVDVGTYEFKGLCIFPKLLGLGILAGYLSC